MGRLHIKGEKEVKGSDFELPSQVELINGDSHIASLTAKTSDLELEITIEKGIAYSPREGRKKEKVEIGTIPIDAIFSPIKRISFKVENMRVGERTDFDKLSLEIETDGTVKPETAFAQASETLVKHFSLLAETFQTEESLPSAKTASGKKARKKKTVSSVKKHEKKKKG